MFNYQRVVFNTPILLQDLHVYIYNFIFIYIYIYVMVKTWNIVYGQDIVYGMSILAHINQG